MSTFLSSPNGAFMKLGSTFLAVPLPPQPTAFYISGHYDKDSDNRAGKWANPVITYVSGVEESQIVRTLNRGYGGRISTSWDHWGKWTNNGTMVQTGLDLTDVYVKTDLVPHWTSRTGDCMFAVCSGKDPDYTMPNGWSTQVGKKMSDYHCPEITGKISASYVNEWIIPSATTKYDSDDVNSFLSFYQYSTQNYCMWDTCNFTASGYLLPR